MEVYKGFHIKPSKSKRGFIVKQFNTTIARFPTQESAETFIDNVVSSINERKRKEKKPLVSP